MKTIPLYPRHHGFSTVVDDADYAEQSQYRWTVMRDLRRRGGSIYAVRRLPGTKQLIYLHRALVQAPNGMLTDHKDGNGLNNQRYNLRVCSRQQNTCNRVACRRLNKASIYKGVTRNRSNRSPWKALIGINYRVIYLGSFATEIEAALAYNAAAVQYHGAFASPNLLPALALAA